MKLESRDNSRLKMARAVRDGKERDLIFVEGLRLSEEALNANLIVKDYFYTPEFITNERGADLIKSLQNVDGAEISGKLLDSVSDTKTPQGIVLIIEKPANGKDVLFKTRVENPLFVALHEINNPSNVGAILRTCEAAFVSGLILTRNSADVFSPKSLRGAMGAAFRVPVWTNAEFVQIIDFCRDNDLKTVCAELGSTKTHFEIDWREPKCLIFGSEAHGLNSHEIALCDETLKIPMRETVESLNVGVACGVILYEAMRQKF